MLGFVQHFEVFLCIRFVQGLGAALYNASGLAILMTLAPADKRVTVLGISTAAVYAGISCGPAIAGLVAGAFGWRWLFWGTALGAVVAWLLVHRNLREEWRQGRGEPFWLSAVRSRAGAGSGVWAKLRRCCNKSVFAFFIDLRTISQRISASRSRFP